MIIGFCGQAGSGKDTSADFLVKNDLFVKVAFADPLKRICQEVYDFTDDQMWGPSSERNKPDLRYRRKPHYHLINDQRAVGDPQYNELRTCNNCGEKGPPPRGPEGECFHYLTPRYALQKLGTEWGRDCYDNTWVDLALRIAKRLGEGGHTYNFRRGLSSCSFVGEDAAGAHDRLKRSVVISDVRFKNEIDAIKKAGGYVIKLLRGEGLEGAAGQHKSETELQGIPLESFDFIIDNREWTLNQLELYLHQLVQLHQGK